MKLQRRKHAEGIQSDFTTFMGKVELTTDKIEARIQLSTPPQQPKSPELSQLSPKDTDQIFKPKHGTMYSIEIFKRISRLWDKVLYKADIDQFFDIALAALERREDDYLDLVNGVDKDVLNCYVEIFSELLAYFIDGNYGDPLGTFYMDRFSHGRGGEYYTPWNVAYMMAKMLDPTENDTICDPCCGSGILLLATRCIIHEKYGWIASSRFGRNMYGMDISSRGAKMAKINMYMTDYIYIICLLQDATITFIQQQEEPVHEQLSDTEMQPV